MRKHKRSAVFAIALLSASTGFSAQAQSVLGPEPAAAQSPSAQATPMAGSVGRIGKFITATELGNSVLFESGGRIGLGTTAPLSSLDIRAQNALSIYGGQPYLTFRDSAAGAALHIIQSINGGLNLLPDSYFRNANASAVVHVSRLGRVGLGTKSPQRLLQIGPSVDAMFTIEASDASPRAGFIRFGDRTGWQLRIGRSRESSGGPLNTGLTGALFTFRDDGAFGPTGYPLLATGVEPLCRTLANFITRCEASSLRYKKDVEPYLGGLDVVERLRPIAFTRIYNGRHDIGLAAEEVEEIDPRLTYPNEEGEVEGVKYDLISAALINAVKEQQAQIERQQEQIEALLAAVARLERTNSTR